MLIEIKDPKPPFDKPPFDCYATVTVGGVVYDIGATARSDLREDALDFASGLQAGVPFAPEFAYEPLFNVDFDGDQFVTYFYRPRFKGKLRWWPGQWWLGSIKMVSKPESIREATAYLTQFVASLEQR